MQKGAEGDRKLKEVHGILEGTHCEVLAKGDCSASEGGRGAGLGWKQPGRQVNQGKILHTYFKCAILSICIAGIDRGSANTWWPLRQLGAILETCSTSLDLSYKRSVYQHGKCT